MAPAVPSRRVLPKRHCRRKQESMQRPDDWMHEVLHQLATHIVNGRDRVVFITGAGLSVPSGIRPFRSPPIRATDANAHRVADSKIGVGDPGEASKSGLWSECLWTTATRESFLKDPVGWYNRFWIPHFVTALHGKEANPGHTALDSLLKDFPNIHQVTQNIDGLQVPPPDGQDGEKDEQDPLPRIMEVHGRVGLYRCVPDEDSSSSDEEEEEESSSDEEDSQEPPARAVKPIAESAGRRRRVHLGRRHKWREYLKRSENPLTCPYEYLLALSPDQLQPSQARRALATTSPYQKSTDLSHEDKGKNKGYNKCNDEDVSCSTAASNELSEAPTCPMCGNKVMPLALLFDEGYHCHSLFQFKHVEDAIQQADVLVFVGTSFAAVRLTHVALKHAKQRVQDQPESISAPIPIFNINPYDTITPTEALPNVTNLQAPAEEALPLLAALCDQLSQLSTQEKEQPSFLKESVVCAPRKAANRLCSNKHPDERSDNNAWTKTELVSTASVASAAHDQCMITEVVQEPSKKRAFAGLADESNRSSSPRKRVAANSIPHVNMVVPLLSIPPPPPPAYSHFPLARYTSLSSSMATGVHRTATVASAHASLGAASSGAAINIPDSLRERLMLLLHGQSFAGVPQWQPTSYSWPF